MPPLPVLLDTDIGSDVDDALALALMIRHPGFDLRAVSSVSGDTTRRARIARKLLHLAGRDDVEVAAGERGEVSHAARSPEGGYEDEMLGDWPPDLSLSPRPGLDVLAEALATGTTHVATVGMQSNLAAVVAGDPTLAGRAAPITVMGGVFPHPDPSGYQFPPRHDHNLQVDQSASIRALNAGFRTLFVPCNVTFQTRLTPAQVDRLRTADPLCRELARQIDVCHAHNRYPDGVMWRLHDPLAVATMVDRRFLTIERLPVTVAMHNGLVRTFIDPLEGTSAEVVTAVDGEAFAEWWLESVLNAP